VFGSTGLEPVLLSARLMFVVGLLQL
jgi:hypothetical protein